MRRHLAWTAVASLLLVPAPSVAQEWTRFRGPNGTGQCEAADIPSQWTDADYRWQVKLPGIGHASPVIWGDKVFLTSANPDTGVRIVLCVGEVDATSSSRSARILWQKEYPASTHQLHTQNSFASSTAAVDEKHVYAAWATPQQFVVVALDHEGHEVWQADLGGYESQHGFGSSPIVHDGMVIIANDQDGESSIVALDCQTGKKRWSVPRRHETPQNASYGTPFVYQPAQGKPQLIVAGWAHGIASLDPSSGSTNWELDVFERRPVASPIMAAGLIFASCGEGSGNNYVVAVRPGTKTKPAEVVYKIDRSGAPYVPSMVARDNLVFLWTDRGIVSCIDAATGKVHWRERVGGNYSGSPVRVGDRLYCVSADGEVVALAAAAEYSLLGRTALGEGCRSTPAVANGILYLRTESQLFAIGGKKG